MNNNIGIIYRLESPSGKSYIGQSWNFRRRITSYEKMSNVNRVQIKLWRALEKYKFSSFYIEILDYCFTQEQMDDSEIYWISYYDSLTNGYNSRYGGSRGKHTKEAIEKIIQANKNRSPELKRKIIETRIKNGYLFQTKEIKTKNRYSNSIYEYTITHPDGTITITTSLNEFCEIYGLNKQSMHKMASGKQRFYNNWKVCRKLLPGKKIRRPTSEEKEMNSKRRMGIPRSKETVEKMKNASKNRYICEEHREILRQNGINTHKKLKETIQQYE